ncbi:MAG: BamA/TamA family outer membrane protein [Bacteroidetes bacterium]|nr:BamA/TamA family outer membrane protein [Bacteroidota bacterium]
MRLPTNNTVLCLVLAFWPLLLYAQDHAPESGLTRVLGIIDTVIVAGNTSTEKYVILNEMSLKPGSPVTQEEMDYDRDRIYSLGLFTRVEIYYDSLATQRFLYVDVRERWHLIPIPIFGFRDGDPKKIFFGGGILHNNLRGRNQKLLAYLTLGYDPSFSVSYYDPLFDHENRLSFSASLSYNRIRNRSEIQEELWGEFDENHYNASVGLGKRFSLYQSANVSAGYKLLKVSEYRPGRTVSTDGTDSFVHITLSYTYDSRDLFEYPTRGTFLQIFVTKQGLGFGPVNFARYGVDVRKYFMLPLKLTLVLRLKGSVVSGGEVPTYAQAYYGYGERIRGYFYTVFQGEDIVGGTVEFRYPLFPATTYHVTFIPLPPEFAYWRFGIGLALFGDTGTTWFRGEKLTWRFLYSGFGGGLDFLLPYSLVVRLQYAWNNHFQGQFILDLRKPV